MGKDGLNKLAALVGGSGTGGDSKEPTDADPEMQAVLDFVQSRGHDLFDAQELLLACCMELHLQIKEDAGDDE